MPVDWPSLCVLVMRVVCTICTDPIQEDFCAAPCGHTFHHECLKQWLAHQKSCPQCREKCLPRSVIKLYTNTSDLTQVSAGSMEPQEMREKLALQETLMSHKHKALEEARTSLDSIQKEMGAWQAQHKDMHKKLKAERSVSEVLRRELSSMHSEMEEAKKASKEMEKMQDRLTKLEGVETVLKGSRDDVNVLLTTHKSNNCLATLVIALKRDYEILKKKRATLLGDKSKHTEETNRLKRQLSKQDKELKLYQEQVSTLELDLHAAEEEVKTLQKKAEMLHSALESPGSRHALQRLLESPMPDFVIERTKAAEKATVEDLGASPLLTSSHSKTVTTVSAVEEDREGVKQLLPLPPPPIVVGAKRPSRSKESNVVLPISKKFANAKSVSGTTLSGSSFLKPFSSNILKPGLKFAPRKNSIW